MASTCMPIHILDAVNSFQLKISATIELRHEFLSGKSGAFVGLVDCTGELDGVYILKVDDFHSRYADEEILHNKAIEEGAFGGKIPKIVATERFENQYLLLIEVAGGSLINYHPLVESPELFKSAYAKLGSVLWTPSLIKHGQQTSFQALMHDVLGYQLEPNHGGRIQGNIETQFGHNFINASHFYHQDVVLPNPFAFCKSQSTDTTIRPLKGPVHGDCHGANVFFKMGFDVKVQDLFLIDLAFYKSSSLFFYDHAYFELATLLKSMDGVGETRWFKLATYLASLPGTEAHELNPADSGWANVVMPGREESINKALELWKDRGDDIRLQFLIAQAAAGLSFVNKRQRNPGDSIGLSKKQYCQAFVWSAVFLKKAIDEASINYCQGQQIPHLGLTDIECLSISEDLWGEIGGFDSSGFNILILSPRALFSQPEISQIFNLDWTLVIDFSTESVPAHYLNSFKKPVRQVWANEIPREVKFLSRGAMWLFANGRNDISDAEPSKDFGEWRRRYSRGIDSFLESLAVQISPADVRALIVGDSETASHIRHISESLDTNLHKELKPILISGLKPSEHPEYIEVERIEVKDFVCRLEAYGDALSSGNSIPLLPCREAESRVLRPVPIELIQRVRRDVAPVYRQLSESLPQDREFGIDFRRGLTIEWAELANNLDIERDQFQEKRKSIVEALEESSIKTINLYHEPSAGGTTLSRRLAWSIMEEYPVIIVEQLTEDTAVYVREIFHYSNLPVLVIMESTIVTESARENLLRQLREDNTRAVFLWISRTYQEDDTRKVSLKCQLSPVETKAFLSAYLETVTDPTRKRNLRELASKSELIEQRTPFFFGLNAFEDNYYGLDQLVENTLDQASTNGKKLLANLSLASAFSSEGFPVHEFDELCDLINEGILPYELNSPYAVDSGNWVRIPHRLIAVHTLKALARDKHNWKADIHLWAKDFIGNISKLNNRDSDRVRKFIETIFLTRDSAIVLEADTDFIAGRQPLANRFSPLIHSIGTQEVARDLLKKLSALWPKEPHFSVHYARHLLYESPVEVERAIQVSERAMNLEKGQTDDVVIHMVGMCYRSRLYDKMELAQKQGTSFDDVEQNLRENYLIACDHFTKATELNKNSEYGHVATIQMVKKLISSVIELANTKDLAFFMKQKRRAWIADALATAEGCIANLQSRPGREHSSIRIKRTIAEWNLVYGNFDSVVHQLRILANRTGESEVRRALCSTMLSRHGRKWEQMPQGDLQTIVSMMNHNVQTRGFRNSDLRMWLQAYRHLNSFDVDFAIQRMLDWQQLVPSDVLPPFYLAIFYFQKWLDTDRSNKGYADEYNTWISICRKNSLLGYKQWGYEWLIKKESGLSPLHYAELSFDPARVIRVDAPDRDKKLQQFGRLSGVMTKYNGPQSAQIDLGHNVYVFFHPLQTVTKDNLGHSLSCIISFTYDGLRGWDPLLIE